jgi:methionyl-tRNA formyltransferase
VYKFILVILFFRQFQKQDILHIHPEKLPDYRGVIIPFWVLKNNEDRAWITIHKVIKEIDAGDICYQNYVDIGESETIHTLLLKLSFCLAINLELVLVEIFNKLIICNKQNSFSNQNYYKRPNKYDINEYLSQGKKFY